MGNNVAMPGLVFTWSASGPTRGPILAKLFGAGVCFKGSEEGELLTISHRLMQANVSAHTRMIKKAATHRWVELETEDGSTPGLSSETTGGRSKLSAFSCSPCIEKRQTTI